ncbi:MAG: double-stranded DNA-binding protein [Nitrososphaerota archaeon]|nr:double-stranded DNA-binding protein [Nitrososphaerota archaeon]
MADEQSEKGRDEQSEDADLKMLHARRMLEIRRRMSESAKKTEEAKAPAPPPTDRQILLKSLIERGDEVLRSAEAAYPEQMKSLIPALAQLIKEGKVKTITGGELLQFLRSIGLRVSVATSISVQDHGKFVSLSEKLKQSD